MNNFTVRVSDLIYSPSQDGYVRNLQCDRPWVADDGSLVMANNDGSIPFIFAKGMWYAVYAKESTFTNTVTKVVIHSGETV